MNTTKISSEIGRLRTVIVHRPGIEIARITPENKEALLFDDLLWLERAQREHDAFTELMTGRGVEVLYFEALLRDILDFEETKGVIIDDIITPARCGANVAERLRETLREAPCDRVVDVLLGGLLERELPEWGVDPLFADLISDRFHYVLRPLPNLLFMRDNASWVNDGLMLNVLATPARERESIYMREIYRHHPRFRDHQFPVWYGNGPHDHYPASIEGGDVLVLSEDTVIIGLGERIEHKPGELSGGERQRAAIARALINDPDCILADEPTGNLDRKNAENALELIMQLNKNYKTSLIMVTHDMHIAERLDTVDQVQYRNLRQRRQHCFS